MKHGHPDFFFWSVLKHSLLLLHLYYHPRSTFLYFPLFESHLEVTRHNQHNEMLPRNRKTARFFPEQVLLMHWFLRIGFFNRSRWKALDLRPYCRPTVIYAVFRTGTIQSGLIFVSRNTISIKGISSGKFSILLMFLIHYLFYIRMIKIFTINNSNIILI